MTNYAAVEGRCSEEMIGKTSVIRKALRVRGPHELDDASKHGTSCKKNERAQENLLGDEQRDETGRGDSPDGSGRNVRNPWADKVPYRREQERWNLATGRSDKPRRKLFFGR